MGSTPVEGLLHPILTSHELGWSCKWNPWDLLRGWSRKSDAPAEFAEITQGCSGEQKLFCSDIFCWINPWIFFPYSLTHGFSKKSIDPTSFSVACGLSGALALRISGSSRLVSSRLSRSAAQISGSRSVTWRGRGAGIQRAHLACQWGPVTMVWLVVEKIETYENNKNMTLLGIVKLKMEKWRMFQTTNRYQLAFLNVMFLICSFPELLQFPIVNSQDLSLHRHLKEPRYRMGFPQIFPTIFSKLWTVIMVYEGS